MAVIADSRCNWLHLAFLASITFVGSLNRIQLAAERPLWLDEAFSVCNSQATSYADLLRWKGEDPDHPPLGFLLMKGSGAVLGTWEPWAVRLIPVLGGVLCIPSAFLLGKAIGSSRLGRWASAFAAVDPLLVEQSGQARSWSLLCLGVILTLVFTVMTLKTAFSLKYCLGLGLTLGLSLWSNLLAWVGCCAAAATLGLGLTQVYFSQTNRPNFARACRGVATALLVAGLIGFPAIVDILTKRLGQSGGPDPPSFSRIVSEIYHSLAALDSIPHVWGLVFIVAFAGIVWLWLRQGSLVIPLVSLATFSFVFAVLLRQRHPFFAPRYLTPLLPVVWIGLATFPSLVTPRIVAIPFQGLLTALLVFHALHSVELTTHWKTRYEFLVSQEVANLCNRIAPGDRVVFARGNCSLFGRYYGLPIDADLENQLWRDGKLSPSKIQELRNSSNTTWFIAARMKSENHLDRSKKSVKGLAGAYGVKVKAKDLAKHFRKFHFIVVRISGNGIDYSSRDLRPQRPTKSQEPEVAEDRVREMLEESLEFRDGR
jgi:uncharacterized membrane protein